MSTTSTKCSLVQGSPDWVDWFGRPVATIFFFLSVEGFVHTHNQKRYLSRLLIGFWIMQIGNAVLQRSFSLGSFGLINNIFGDLFVGVLTMYGIQTLSQGRQSHQASKIWGWALHHRAAADLCCNYHGNLGGLAHKSHIDWSGINASQPVNC